MFSRIIGSSALSGSGISLAGISLAGISLGALIVAASLSVLPAHAEAVAGGPASPPPFLVELPPEAAAPVNAPSPVAEASAVPVSAAPPAFLVDLPAEVAPDFSAKPVQQAAPAAPEAPAAQTAQTAAAPVPAPVPAVNAAIRASVEALAKAPASTLQAKRERDALVAFYTARNFAPVWIADSKFSTQAGAALQRLERARDDALDLGALSLPSLRAGTEAEMAADEFRLSQAVVAYGRQAGGARIAELRTIGLITSKPEIADAQTILDKVSTSADAGEALLGFNPPQPGYKALREKLAELRRENVPVAAAKEKVRITPGPVLRIGMKDPRVPLVRARFGLDANAEGVSDTLVYDTRVATAVADFQRTVGLPASGTLTPRTISALSGGEPTKLEGELIANMERWRWMPREMGTNRIEVNIPDYTVRVYRENEEIHRARVIVGKPQNPTPVFSDRMQHVIVNPYWNVPVSIIKKEMMPAAAKDPSYFTRRGYEVTYSRSGQMIVRQPPGERNALGRIKFMFPNEHSVYLHDTSSRGLFVNERRAYSHGCVRVDQPFKFAEIVLGKDNGWSEERVKKMIGGGERMVPLPKHIPIHIGYFTAFVDDAGKLQMREDVYGYSRKVRAALGVDG